MRLKVNTGELKGDHPIAAVGETCVIIVIDGRFVHMPISQVDGQDVSVDTEDGEAEPKKGKKGSDT